MHAATLSDSQQRWVRRLTKWLSSLENEGFGGNKSMTTSNYRLNLTVILCWQRVIKGAILLRCSMVGPSMGIQRWKQSKHLSCYKMQYLNTSHMAILPETLAKGTQLIKVSIIEGKWMIHGSLEGSLLQLSGNL